MILNLQEIISVIESKTNNAEKEKTILSGIVFQLYETEEILRHLNNAQQQSVQLDDVYWACSNCGNGNRPHEITCNWCAAPRTKHTSEKKMNIELALIIARELKTEFKIGNWLHFLGEQSFDEATDIEIAEVILNTMNAADANRWAYTYEK